MTTEKKLFIQFSKLVVSFVFLVISLILFPQQRSAAQPLELAGQPVELSIVPVSEHTLRITLSPVGNKTDAIPVNDGCVLVTDDWGDPILSVTELSSEQTVTYRKLQITVRPSPFSVEITREKGEQVQHLVFDEETGHADFDIGDDPVFGLGNGGQYFDRRGIFYSMERGHRHGESQIFGARTPIPFLIGTDGWSMFFHRPYNGRFDLRGNSGHFLPLEKPESKKEASLPLDIFVTNVDSPPRALSEYSKIIGKPAMPPRWALGYMQSHRNLFAAGPEGIMEVARTFRERELPIDALIYLGTGFTPVGWNTGHGEFEFHPEAFDRPRKMIDEMHELNYKLVLHLTQPPRDLHGHIPPKEGETVDSHHVASYWDEHKEVFSMGVDGWWPDMGDPLDNDKRLTRHYMYREGPLQERPNERPWSLHRTGFAGMQRFGGWNWSGDVISSWETLASHIPIGLNASLSTSPYWGTDIGGFYPPLGELTGELYVRWFQFGAFTPSFRAHGRIWRTRLPWGWNPGEIGPVELKEYVKGETSTPDTLDLEYEELDLHTTRVEPIVKDYLELRYRLMPYLYTTVRETHDTGLPPMQALWLHYPDDQEAVSQSHQYLWGRDILVAPVVEKDVNVREVYLPEGEWYDFWGGDDPIQGQQYVKRFVDLETMPIYVRAGTILPLDPVRQHMDEPTDEPTTLRIYPGSDGDFELYDDDGQTLDFQDGEYSKTQFSWDDEERTLSITSGEGNPVNCQFRIEIVGEDREQTVDYEGTRKQVKF